MDSSCTDVVIKTDYNHDIHIDENTVVSLQLRYGEGGGTFGYAIRFI
jgi:hypothetical protein